MFRHSATRSTDSSWLPGQKKPDLEPVMKKKKSYKKFAQMRKGKSKPSKKKNTAVSVEAKENFVDYGLRGNLWKQIESISSLNKYKIESIL